MVLRVVKSGLRKAWERRLVVAPLALAFLGLAALGLTPSFEQFRLQIWAGLVFAAISLALAVAIYRVRTMVQVLSAENTKLRRALQDTNQSQQKSSRMQERRSRALEERSQALEGKSRALERRTRALVDKSRKLAGKSKKLGQRIDKGEAAAERRLASINSGIRAMGGALEKIEGRAQTISAKLSKTEDGAKARHDAFEARVAEFARLHHQLDADLVEIAGKQTALEKNVHSKASAEELATWRKHLQELRNEVAAFNQRYGGLDELTDQLDEKIATLSQRAAPNNAIYFQRFNRQLEKSHSDELSKVWGRRLSISASESTLGYMAARACQVESFLQGRLATSIEDMLLRTLVAQSVKRDQLEVLEIGTLFGIGASVIYDAVAPHFESVRFTLLDPLDGYYAMSGNDVLTGQPVSEEMLRRNLRRVGMKASEFTLIKRMSTEPEAVSEASRRKYDVLIIDGDHSYAGVKTDFENFAPMVRVGGYVIFDDYGSPSWPEVKGYVDAEVKKNDWIANVGAGWRTAVYRIVREPGQAAGRANEIVENAQL